MSWSLRDNKEYGFLTYSLDETATGSLTSASPVICKHTRRDEHRRDESVKRGALYDNRSLHSQDNVLRWECVGDKTAARPRWWRNPVTRACLVDVVVEQKNTRERHRQRQRENPGGYDAVQRDKREREKRERRERRERERKKENSGFSFCFAIFWQVNLVALISTEQPRTPRLTYKG